MRWREVLSKRTIILLVIILGLISVGIAVYVKLYLYSERILVEGEPVYIWAYSFHPERCKVNATAWWEPYPYGPDKLRMEITLVELDVNNTYHLGSVWLNPHYGQEPYEETTVEGAATFITQFPKSEGDIIHVTFGEEDLGSEFKLRDGNRVDVVLKFSVLKEKVVEGVSFWIDHMYVGELKFSVEVQGEIPPEYR